MKTELIIGCGHNKFKSLMNSQVWENPTTLDRNTLIKPDIIHDLEDLPYPFEDESFDEIHAYEVLEHIGQQGDYKTFFAQFMEFYRLLKPNGRFFGTTPSTKSGWLWGDPNHKRVVSKETLFFLRQTNYNKSKNSAMSEYRDVFIGDFEPLLLDDSGMTFCFILQAIKPSRIDIQEEEDGNN